MSFLALAKKVVVDLKQTTDCQRHQSPTAQPADPLVEEIEAVLINSRLLAAEIWLVRDADALDRLGGEIGGRPVFFFDEVEKLKGKSAQELRAIAITKRVFPRGRVLQ